MYGVYLVSQLLGDFVAYFSLETRKKEPDWRMRAVGLGWGGECWLHGLERRTRIQGS